MAVSQAEAEATRGPTSSSAETQNPLVLLLRKGGKKTPFYFISAGADEPRLAKLMGEDRPIYGIQISWPAAWLEAAKSNDVSSIPRLQEFAAPFVDALLEHLGPGPCILAGHSFAAILAFEVGRQFQMRGGKVDAVIIIDKRAHMEDIYSFLMMNIRRCWSGKPTGPGLTGDTLASRVNRFALTLRWLLGKAKVHAVTALLPAQGELTTVFDAKGVPLRWPVVMRFYRNMHRNYRPTPLDCRGIVIRATGGRYASILAADKQMGWGGLFTKGVVVHEFAGIGHNSIIRENAQLLVSAITEAVSAY